MMNLLRVEDAEDEIKKINTVYSERQYRDTIDRISQGLNRIQNGVYKSVFDPLTKYFEEYKENMTGDALLLLNEDEINETLDILNKIKTGIDEGNQKIRKQSMDY